jgi:hypothetical protein
MRRHLTTFLCPIFLLLLPACQSGGSGGKDRYEYPTSKLSNSKTVKGASLDGRFVILTDGSTWNIDWDDASKARRWSAGDRVNVIATQGGGFPYTLIKQGSGERVAARYGRKL